LVPSGDSITGYRMLREAGLPVVLLDRLLDVKDSSYVISNDEEGAYLAVKYLIDLGHRGILYIGGIHNTSTEAGRLRGHSRALRECGIPQNDQSISECSFDSESAYAAMKNILPKKDLQFSAVFAGNDLIAFGIKKALEEIGLMVPRDVSLVGYGDMPFASLISLTSVCCPAFEMGKSALSLLIQIMEKKYVSSHKTIMRPTLILRSSCMQISVNTGRIATKSPSSSSL
jgi:DNA-binding LacI/PurR family transcriptional regulator